MNNKKLNILYHHRTQGRGAEGVHITSIVNALEAMGHSVTVVSPPGINPMIHAGNAPVDKSNVKTKGIDSLWKFISKNLPGFLFEISEIIYNIPAMRNLENVLSTGKYDIIYERYAFYMVAGVIKAKKHKIPFILEANEVSGINDRARKQVFIRLCKVFEKFIFKKCTSIHTVSSYLKNMIIKQGVPDKDIYVTPNAIDPDKFSTSEKSPKLVEKYNLNNKVVIGFAGWFDEWDRLDLLANVFIKMKKNNPNLVLLLIGDGAVLDNVKNIINANGIQDDVIFTGPVSRKVIHTYLSLLDIAVITHSNEFGSPVVLFEFMGLKIPVVAPNLMPITDVLVDKKTAMIFETLDMHDLENTLQEMINSTDLRVQISDNAYKILMSNHTWHMNSKEILKSSGVVH